MDKALLLQASLGEPGSGRARYGAAMTLYREGKISSEQLEVFRVASANDATDPCAMFQQRGLPLPGFARADPESLIRTLIDQADIYLSGFSGAGVAEVRSGIARFREHTFSSQVITENNVVSSHLKAALQEAEKTQPLLASLIAASAPYLSWITYELYDRKEIGESFATSHAYCTIIGETGPIRAKDFDLGLFLIAPHVLYRDHHHAAPELYAPLTGPHGWRFKSNAPLIIKDAHDLVWNEPHAPHLTKVGTVPFLCIYGWTRDTDKPARVLHADDWGALEALRL